MMLFARSILLLNIVTLCFTPPLFADLVIGGSATIEFDTSSSMFSSLALDRFYGTGSGVDSATGTEITAGTGGGVDLSSSSGLVNLNHTVNGASVTNPDARRGRQATNADIDTTSAATIAASWSSNEQFGIDGVTRFSTVQGPFVLGDFAVTFDSLNTRLTLVNNFDFPNSPTFYVDTPTFVTAANGFTASGDLRIGSTLGLFGFSVGDDVGFFNLNATTAVPEPSSGVLLSMSSLGLALMRRRKLLAR
ncbi:PEP-CTERM sorting domain-containing protein [Aureliella helgolandensis]|uniref:Uncharacterized protein n=1 Tax=Aureliella helgolandensis TaxID=2527968 RepID=A0A518GB76_9BACT|nr:PEP-CTERM sorting domain-containing protein [Aureliella helgolandensis]QDV25829.1 hypothetical protein Q31a_41570 [Aureliella helgolandensis]